MLTGGAILPTPAVLGSTRIAARLKRVHVSGSPVNVSAMADGHSDVMFVSFAWVELAPRTFNRDSTQATREWSVSEESAPRTMSSAPGVITHRPHVIARLQVQ